MRYLFIVQGEGRGHMTQAIALGNMLRKHGHEVVEMLIGKSPQREIPSYFIKKAGCQVEGFDSPNFIPGKKNQKTSILKSVIYNFRKSSRFLTSLLFLESKIKTHQPDVVINFYDLIAGLLFEIKRPKVKFVCIAHQYLFLHPHFKFPKPPKPEIAALLYYTKLTCRKADKILALSLGTKPNYNSKHITIVPPLMREEVFRLEPETGDFILGYMVNPTFESQIINWHDEHPECSIHIFSDRKQCLSTELLDYNLRFSKINDDLFIRQLSKCKAYATTAGFESICEAMYLGKPVLMIPAHIEQYCNMIDAERAGAGIGAENFNLSKLIDFIPRYRHNPGFVEWVNSAEERMMECLV
jgi:uncharacterized protein (TIGR00661 family)